MSIGEEVVKTYKMVKEAGFEVVDVIFEGSMTVKGKDVLAQLEELAGKNKALGMVKVIYSAGPDKLRQIEIPVGDLVPSMEPESTI
jgi:hypothetical protein